MSGFLKYQHIERFGTDEVDGIEYGRVYVFPKVDGTNSSIWIEDGQICAGSRNRKLSLDNDNAGFLNHCLSCGEYKTFFSENPDLRLYGEWLVPHSLKTYRDEAWRKFYVFDVLRGDEYLIYEDYKQILEHYNINYIPPDAIINNPSSDQLLRSLEKNNFLIKDNHGVGEGVVLKNYEFYNKFGKQNWAKIVTNEFKEKHKKEMGPPEIKGKKIIENEIADLYTTKSLCEKVHAKIKNESGFSPKDIPRYLNTVYYDVIKEDIWNIIKEFKSPTIKFSFLKKAIYRLSKKYLSEILAENNDK